MQTRWKPAGNGPGAAWQKMTRLADRISSAGTSLPCPLCDTGRLRFYLRIHPPSGGYPGTSARCVIWVWCPSCMTWAWSGNLASPTSRYRDPYGDLDAEGFTARLRERGDAWLDDLDAMWERGELAHCFSPDLAAAPPDAESGELDGGGAPSALGD